MEDSTVCCPESREQTATALHQEAVARRRCCRCHGCGRAPSARLGGARGRGGGRQRRAASTCRDTLAASVGHLAARLDAVSIEEVLEMELPMLDQKVRRWGHAAVLTGERSRCDEVFELDEELGPEWPDASGRVRILEVPNRGKRLPNDVDFEKGKCSKGSPYCVTTPGFTGADLQNLMNEVAIIAAHRDLKEISKDEISNALERIIAGPEKNMLLFLKRTTSLWFDMRLAMPLLAPSCLNRIQLLRFRSFLVVKLVESHSLLL
ncbi:hypothetical protein EJB05_46185, partial [Eragrostis curvula]